MTTAHSRVTTEGRAMGKNAARLAELGRAEFLAAIDAAQKDTIAKGHTATVVRDLERMAA